MENKSLTIMKLIILTIIAIVLILILCVLLFQRNINLNVFDDRDYKSNIIYDKEIEDDISSIVTNAKSSDIRFELTDNEKVYVKIYGRDKEKISVENNEKELKIVEEGNGFCIGFCFNYGYYIVVSIPRDKQYDLNAFSASGDIDLDSINTNDLKINTISGNITARDYKSGTFESVSGDISIENIGFIKAKTVSGEIDINEVSEKADLSTTSGDIEINILNIKQNSKINTVSGNVEIQDNNSYIKTDTVSGDVDVLNNDRHAEVETSIKTTSGDIEVGR